jgi:hypothetical protein
MVAHENIGETDTSQIAESAVNKTIPLSGEDDSEIKISPLSDKDDSEIKNSPTDEKSPKAKKTRVKEGVANNSDCSEDESDVTEEDGILWKTRMLVGSLVSNEKVQIFILAAIMVNAVMMGIATFDFVEENEAVDNVFTQVDQTFLIIFTVEASMQLFYLGLSLFSDGWLIFDLAIVVLSWSFESLQIVRAFRIFRAFRLITRVKPLRDLVLAIGAVLPRMYAIAALLLLIFYIFSVLFTELFSDLEMDRDYFGTLDKSLFTCMELMTLEWGEICRTVMLTYKWAWAPFLAFIAITGFIVFNLIVAVVCDAVAVTEKTVRQMDGYEEDNTEIKIIEAQERIDLLQSHIHDMLKTQEQVHTMIEQMAEELVFLQTERMNAEQREARLRKEVEEREEYQAQMEEKYFEGKKKRDELRNSSIHGSAFVDVDSIFSDGDGESTTEAPSVRERKKQLNKRVSNRRSGTNVVEESIGENDNDSTGASFNQEDDI